MKKSSIFFSGIFFNLFLCNLFAQTVNVCTVMGGHSDRTDSIKISIGPNAQSDSVIVFWKPTTFSTTPPHGTIQYAVGDELIGSNGAICIYKGLANAIVAAKADSIGALGFFRCFSFIRTEAKPDSCRYSTATAYTGRTAFIVPFYFDFNKEVITGGVPLPGWSKTSVGTSSLNAFNCSQTGLNVDRYPCVSSTNGNCLITPNNATSIDIISPYLIFPKTGNFRISFFYNCFDKTGSTLNNPKKPAVGDTLFVLISANGVKWDTVVALHANSTNINLDGYDMKATVDFPITNTKLLFRFLSKTLVSTLFSVGNIRVEEAVGNVINCQTPTNITVLADSITPHSAIIKWDDVNRFDALNCHIRVGDQLIVTDENPYKIEGLTPGTTYQINMRSQCTSANADSSEWSKKIVGLKTNYTLPMHEDLTQNIRLCDQAISYPYILPNWKKYQVSSTLPDTIKIANYTAISEARSSNTWRLDTSKNNARIDNKPFFSSLHSKSGSAISVFLTSPLIQLEGKSKIEISMDLFFGLNNMGQFLTFGTSKGLFSILYSLDKGKTWIKNNTLGSYGTPDLNVGCRDKDLLLDTINTKRTFYINNLENISDIALCFLFEHPGFRDTWDNNFRLNLANIKVQKVCQTPTKDTVTQVTEESVTITYANASETGLLKYWKTNGDSISKEMNNRTCRLTNLEEGTTYYYYIQGICGTDSSDILRGSFTTLTLHCDTVLNIRPGAGQYKAIIVRWKANAEKYNLIYRNDINTVWDTVKNILDTAYTIRELTYNQKYWVSIQADCGKRKSKYSAAIAFYTLTLDCEIPHTFIHDKNLSTPFRTYVDFSGEATNYQARYRDSSQSEWNMVTLSVKQLDFISKPSTTYAIQIRSICLDIDTTAWSDIYYVNSENLPPCELPSNLIAGEITNESALLTWETVGNDYVVQFQGRKLAASNFTEKATIAYKSEYFWESLEKNSTYEWQIRKVCSSYDTTNWTELKSFTTIDVSNNPLLSAECYSVYCKAKQLMIQNPHRKNIKTVEVFNTHGQLIRKVEPKTVETITIDLHKNRGVVLVRIVSFDTIYTYKIQIQ